MSREAEEPNNKTAASMPEQEPATDEAPADEGELFAFDPDTESTSSLDDEVRAALSPPTEQDLVRRRGLVAGWLIAWPFLLLTLAACVIAVALQAQERPQLLPFTLGLYLCMGFFAHAYSLAWRMEAHLRQFLALLATVAVLLGLSALHLDDATDRWVYRAGTRVLREQRPLLFVSALLDVFAALVIIAHGLGLGLGNRFFRRESGERIEHYELRRILREIEDKERQSAAAEREAPSASAPQG